MPRSSFSPEQSAELRNAFRAQALSDIHDRTMMLASLRPGQGRNNAGFSAMRAVGRYVVHGLVSEAEFLALFHQAYHQNGLLGKTGLNGFRKKVQRALAGCAHDPLPALNNWFRDASPVTMPIPVVTLPPSPADPPKLFQDQSLRQQGFRLAVVYQFYDADGKPVFQKLRYERPSPGSGARSKTFLIRHKGPDLNWYSGRGGPDYPFHLPDLLKDPTEPVVICEGEKDANTARRLGLTGVSVSNWSDCLLFFRNRDVILVPDNDAAGRQTVERAVERLKAEARSIAVVPLPGLGPKQDLTDWVETGGTRAAFDALGTNPENIILPPVMEKGPDQELVLLTCQPHRIMQDINRILGRTARVFKRGNDLVELNRSGIGNRRTLVPVKPGRLLTLVHQNARVLRRASVRKRLESPDGDNTLIPCELPMRLCTTFLEQGSEQWPDLHELAGLAFAPILEPDGTICKTPGYHPTSKLYLEIDERGWDSVERPEQCLMQWFELFPFESSTDRAIHLAALLTAIIRPALNTAPAFVYNATAPGTGKTMLARCCGLLAYGFEPTLSGYPYENAELNKRLDGMILGGKPLAIFDNINRCFGNDQICQLITAAHVDVRRLGSTDEHAVANKLLIFGTGNNIALYSDMDRRTLICNLDANMENPQARQFAFNPALEVKQHRKSMVMAALQLLSRARLAGHLTKRAGSFEDWGLVADAVFLATGINVAERLMFPEDISPDRQSFIEIIELWHEKQLGLLTAREIFDAYERRFDFSADKNLVALAESIIGAMNVSGTRKALSHTAIGRYLGSRKNRVAGDLKLFQIKQGNKRAAWYKVASKHQN